MKALQAMFAILAWIGGLGVMSARATGHGAAAAQAVVEDAHTQIITHVPQPAPAPDHDDVISHYVGPPIAPPPVVVHLPGSDPGPDAPLSTQPEIVWETRPDFIHDVYFANDAWAPPLAVPPSERPGQWGNEIWKKGDLWLVVETSKAPAQSRLCVRWPAPDDRDDHEECQTLPEGSARLAFRSAYSRIWPKGRYQIELSLRTGDDPTIAAGVIGMVSYGAGGLAEAITSPPPHPGPDIPTFALPAPQPTSKATIDRGLLARDGETLGDVANRLTAALALAGYDASNRSFYWVTDGFALATRMEQIDVDGTPKPVPLRWSTALPPRAVFSLGDFVHALFTANEGHYRVIVFVVTPVAVTTTSSPPTETEAQEWLTGGLTQLPAAIANLPFGDDYQCTALVYEFHKIASEPTPIANPDGAPSAVEQMQRSGITDALEQ